MIAPTQLHILVMLRLDVLRISTRSRLSNSFFTRSLLHKVSQVSHLDGACLYILQSSCSSHIWDWETQLPKPKRPWCKEEEREEEERRRETETYVEWGKLRGGEDRQREGEGWRGRWCSSPPTGPTCSSNQWNDAITFPLFHLKLLLLSQIFPCLSACLRMNKRLRPKRQAFLTELVRTSLPASLYSKAALTYGEERDSFLHLHLYFCLPGWSFQTGVVLQGVGIWDLPRVTLSRCLLLSFLCKSAMQNRWCLFLWSAQCSSFHLKVINMDRHHKPAASSLHSTSGFQEQSDVGFFTNFFMSASGFDMVSAWKHIARCHISSCSLHSRTFVMNKHADVERCSWRLEMRWIVRKCLEGRACSKGRWQPCPTPAFQKKLLGCFLLFLF